MLLRTLSTAARARRVIEIAPTKAHTSTIIFLHGLGDTGEGWRQPFEMIAKTLPQTKILLPTAPSVPVTLNMGTVMPSWYDIEGLSERIDEQLDGIDDSRATVDSLIETEHAIVRQLPLSD